MPIFIKAFLWTLSSKSSLYWKHSALGAWPEGPAWSLCTAQQALGVCWSRCAGSQTSGGSSNTKLSLNSLKTIRNAAPLHLLPKANTTAGSTSSQEAEVSLFDSPFLWYSNLSRAMNVALSMCYKVLSLTHSPLKVSFSVTRRGTQGTGQLYFLLCLPGKVSAGLFFLPVVLFVSQSISNQT